MKSIVSVLCLAAAPLFAADLQPLWPEGKIPNCQEHQIAAPWEEVRKPGFDRAAHRMPYLEWSAKPAKPNGACMILISGGGYWATVDGPMFRPLEQQLLSNGVTCVWLWYRTPQPKGLAQHQSAWEDGQRAVRLVRAAAKERGFDPEKIGVLGCSAGSHLSVLLATSSQTPAYTNKVDAIDELPCHINWAVPMCVAFVLSDGPNRQNEQDGDGEFLTLDPALKFDAKTCPMCFLHGGADFFSPNGSTRLYRKLREMKIPAEVHIDPDRGHGPVDPKKFERAIEFMRQMGYLEPLQPEVDLMTRFTADGRRAYEKQPVWPEGKMPNADTNQCTPELVWSFPKKLTTKAIQIIYSGGSYMGNSTYGHEVAPARCYLNDKGMTVVTLTYRTPNKDRARKHLAPWQDLQRTIRLVRSQAAEKGLDPNRIGIMGSSAGGHLTLMGATSSRHHAYYTYPEDPIDKIPCNVQWAVAIYPAYALTDGIDWHNTTGGNADSARLVPEFSFDRDTCPILFIHGDADGWAAMNSVKCWEQLKRMGIQGELHTLCRRNHCFQFKASPGTGSYTWLDRIWDFMTVKGFNK